MLAESRNGALSLIVVEIQSSRKGGRYEYKQKQVGPDARRVIRAATIATAIWLIFTSTHNLLAVMPTPFVQTKVSHTPSPAERNIVIRALICAYALEYKIEPAAAMAVAHIESRKGKREFRTGLMGKTYYGPFGIHRCFIKKWPVDKLETNIKVGVKALSRSQNLKKSLRKYNAAFTESYWLAIQEARRKYRKKGVSG